MWLRKLKGLIQTFESKVRRTIAVDETELKVNGHHVFVWAAIDVDSREMLALDAGWQRFSMNSEHVLKRALRLYLNKPLVLVDKVLESLPVS